MKVSDLQDYLKYVMENYGDIEIVTSHREENWLYSEFVPITNVDVEREQSAVSDKEGPCCVVIS